MRVQKRPDASLVIRSDNSRYEEQAVGREEAEKLEILGLVVALLHKF